jgi:hypothetical protein
MLIRGKNMMSLLCFPVFLHSARPLGEQDTHVVEGRPQQRGVGVIQVVEQRLVRCRPHEREAVAVWKQ